MKKLTLYIAGTALALMPTSCIQEFPAQQNGYVTSDQASEAPGAFDNFVSGIIDNSNGQFLFGSEEHYSNDFGYASIMLRRDVTGCDIVAWGGSTNWFSSWYQAEYTLGPTYLNCQYTWTFYFKQIKACNQVIQLAGETPSEENMSGVGTAYAMRALYYLDLAQIYAPRTYRTDKDAPTVPIITEKTTLEESQNNPCATNEKMFAFIIEDLDKAEKYLAGYERPNKYTPDLSVAYGLKARAYLVMGEWENAKTYARKAMEGYRVLTAAEYTDRNNGFNNANYGNSWMLALQTKPTDPCQTINDGDNSWGTWMICEFPSDDTGLGYYNAYGACQIIDRHLYETVPATDCRKKCYLDFEIDDLETKADILTALTDYTDVPEYVYGTGQANEQFGGLSLKFRSKDGNHSDPQYVGWCVDIPMMRVEEMKLIEAEAAGMINEGEGKTLLEQFAKTRDPEYVYGTHNEAYYNTKTSAFQNEIWWQRRIEFWAEGLAMFDIKRLEKGIIRSYAGTNHVEGYRWNVTGVPNWMNFCIIQTETNFNKGITDPNPAPVTPSEDSPLYSF